MINELLQAYPIDTVYNSINNFLTAKASKSQEKISNFINGQAGLALPYKQYVVKATDFYSALNAPDGPSQVITAWENGSASALVDMDEFAEYIGDSVISSEIIREAVASVGKQTSASINEDTTRLRSSISAQFGALSENATKCMDLMANILNSNASKASKLRGILDLISGSYVSGTGFETPIDDYTGVNPWVALFSADWPSFTTWGQYLSDLGRWIAVTDAKLRRWHTQLVFGWINNIKNWFSIQANPFDLVASDHFDDYSLNTGFVSTYLEWDTVDPGAHINELISYVYEHGNQVLCLPTLGATWYFQPSTDAAHEHPQYGGLNVYLKKHVYNYSNSNTLRRVSSFTYAGNPDEAYDEWQGYVNSIGSLAPVINDQSIALENDLFNGLIQAEYLIPLGVSLLTGDPSEILNTIDRYADMSIYSTAEIFCNLDAYDPASYISSTITNNTWLSEYTYVKDDSSQFHNYVLNTLVPIIVDNIVYNDDETTAFIPYMWTEGQLNGFASIKTDSMNISDVKNTLKTIGIVAGVTVAAIAIGVGIGKLKSAAFSASRIAEKAVYDRNYSDSQVRSLTRKATVLSKISGTTTNAVVGSTISLKSAWTDYNKIDQDDTDLTKRVNAIIALIR